MIEYSKNQGFSLVEVLLASVLGIVLVGGMVEIFMNNKAAYKLQEGLARVQENGRMAYRILSEELRPAGYQGCSNLDSLEPNIIATGVTFDVNSIVSGYDHNGSGQAATAWTPNLPTWLTANVGGNGIRAGTDVILIRKAVGDGANLTASLASATADIVIDKRYNINANDLLFISDCHKSDIFRATAVTDGGTTYTLEHKTPSNSTTSLSKAYQTDALVSPFRLKAYYVKDSGRTNHMGAPIYSLYEQSELGTERELIEGVENIQLAFGVDMDGDGNADTFASAAQVETNAQWGNVISINISALISSIENVYEGEQAYTFNGISVSNPGDHQARRQWDIFVTLRNRSF
jgi:type IV pilus assembly protein PilW